MTSIFDQDLPRNAANFAPLSPLSFIERAAEVYPQRPAVVHGDAAPQLAARPTSAAAAWPAPCRRGIGKGDTVAVMLPNTPPMVEAHFGIPMAGAVLNTLNTRLDAEAIAFMLDHGEAKAVIVDPEFAGVMQKAIALRKEARPLLVIDVEDALLPARPHASAASTYEEFLAGGDPAFAWAARGRVGRDRAQLHQRHHRQPQGRGLPPPRRGRSTRSPTSSNGTWPSTRCTCGRCPCSTATAGASPWTMAARAGVNVCLRKVEAKAMVDAIREHGVTHYCGAPIVHGLLVNAPEELKQGLPAGVKAMVAGAAPPASLIEGMERSAST